MRHTDKTQIPQSYTVRPENIPPQLIEGKRWVTWTWEWSEEKANWTKPPRQLNGKLASSTDPGTWCGFDEALAAYQDNFLLCGIGRVLGRSDKLVLVDFDDAYDSVTREIDQRVTNAIRALGSYTEWSPTGGGFHVILQGHMNTGRRTPLFEAYPHGRYTTVTGCRLPNSPDLDHRQDALETLLNEQTPPQVPSAPPSPRGEAHSAPQTHLRDDEVLSLARKAKNGVPFQRLYDDGDLGGYDGDHSRADLALLGFLRFYTDDPSQLDRLMRSSALRRGKWDRSDYAERSIGKVLRGGGEHYTPSKQIVADTRRQSVLDAMRDR